MKKQKGLLRIISVLLVILLAMSIMPLSVIAQELDNGKPSVTQPNDLPEDIAEYVDSTGIFSASKIIGEVPEYREESTKYFRCSDGT